MNRLKLRKGQCSWEKAGLGFKPKPSSLAMLLTQPGVGIYVSQHFQCGLGSQKILEQLPQSFEWWSGKHTVLPVIVFL